jgi:hypothetical protein
MATDGYKDLIPTKIGVNTARKGKKRKKIISRIIGRKAGEFPGCPQSRDFSNFPSSPQGLKLHTQNPVLREFHNR